jgi:hypothetical protein
MAGYTDKPWTPKFWLGMKCSAWLRVIAQNRFAVSLHRIPMALFIASLGPFHWAMARMQQWRFGRDIDTTDIHPQPVFILGHWRTGTTLLHELLALDDRFTCPDTYACFAPNHFLVTRKFITPWLKRLMPKTRPTDNMAAGFDHPQEDEFALCNMGIPSPYLDMIFPNRPKLCDSYYDLQSLSAEEREHWNRAYRYFLKSGTVQEQKPLVLKSPYHMCRLPILLELFPQARFIHITRDPYKVFSSTLQLWQRLCRDQGLQTPRYDKLETYILQRYKTMYAAFEQTRWKIPPGTIVDIKYEDLVSGTEHTLENVYAHLGLGSFEHVRDAVKNCMNKNSGYQPNHFILTPEQQEAVTRHWLPLMEQYGYSA